MSKEIWLPDSKTHVIVEDGKVKVWDSMVMVREELNKKRFGFDETNDGIGFSPKPTFDGE